MSALRSAASRAAPYLLLALILLTRFAAVVYAQTATTPQPQTPQPPPITCPDPNTVRDFVRALQSVVLVAIVVIVLLVMAFNVMGTTSMIAMRLGEFFTERLRLVFELILIYVLFLWGLENAIGPEGGQQQSQQQSEKCAQVNWDKLFNEGPLFFRLVGWVLKALGIYPQPQR